MKNLSVQESKIQGRGVYAASSFAQGEIVLEFLGKHMRKQDVPVNPSGINDRFIQIALDEYIAGSGDVDDYLNHSCDPSCKAEVNGGRCFLVALREIRAGEEITFDYATTMCNDDFTMKCRCGASNCRGVIREFRYLPQSVRERYIEARMVPSYVIRENL